MSVRVLVVDDQEPFRLAAAAVIAAADGFELVGSADTGEASVAAVEELRPDLVLMDVHLPGIDGPESTRRIRARRPAVSVLLVSSSHGEPDYEECGAMGYLAKQRLSPAQLHRFWASRGAPAEVGTTATAHHH
jgi:DNA-binding NarL/FixJ family response regulator